VLHVPDVVIWVALPRVPHPGSRQRGRWISRSASPGLVVVVTDMARSVPDLVLRIVGRRARPHGPRHQGYRTPCSTSQAWGLEVARRRARQSPTSSARTLDILVAFTDLLVNVA
jgi:hypothetical protein